MLYRGVHGQHPALEAARRGEVIPSAPESDLPAEDHNGGGYSDVSPFTSWTYDRAYAYLLARRAGPGGIVLEVPDREPGPNDLWSWHISPDEDSEDEVLLRGIRLNVEVHPA